MANTQKDVTFWISPTAQPDEMTQTDFEALADWIQVKQVGNLGQTGSDTNILSYDTLDTSVTQKAKGITNAGDPTIECARVYDDAGQVQMRASAATNFNYAFKTIRNDAPSAAFSDTIIYNRGLVIGPTRPNGRNEDFDLEVFTLALQQEEIVVDPATV